MDASATEKIADSEFFRVKKGIQNLSVLRSGEKESTGLDSKEAQWEMPISSLLRKNEGSLSQMKGRDRELCVK